jgi:hypothetical protein
MQFICQQARLSRSLSVIGHTAAKGGISHHILASSIREAGGGLRGCPSTDRTAT